MTIENRIKLKNKNYYIVVETVYKTKENGLIALKLKNYKDDYYDSGNLSLLMKQIEKSYHQNTTPKYDTGIAFLDDCLFIYERIPFLTQIKDLYISQKDNVSSSIATITKEELDTIIKENNIKIDFNPNFKLADARTWASS